MEKAAGGRESDDLRQSSTQVKKAWDFSRIIPIMALLQMEGYGGVMSLLMQQKLRKNKKKQCVSRKF